MIFITPSSSHHFSPRLISIHQPNRGSVRHRLVTLIYPHSIDVLQATRLYPFPVRPPATVPSRYCGLPARTVKNITSSC